MIRGDDALIDPPDVDIRNWKFNQEKRRQAIHLEFINEEKPGSLTALIGQKSENRPIIVGFCTMTLPAYQ